MTQWTRKYSGSPASSQLAQLSTPELQRRIEALRERREKLAALAVKASVTDWGIMREQTAEGVRAFATQCMLESPDSEFGEIPFEPYDCQVAFWRALLEECARLDRGEKPDIIRCEKSRQMGLSWAAALFILWSLTAWKFAWRALVLSYNEDLVDDGGTKATTDSLFGKVRFMWERLPPEFQAPLEFRLGHIVNTSTGASAVGKSTSPASKRSGGGGRGGSYRYGFWDEAAFGAHSQQVMAGFSQAARVKVLWSTANGKTGAWGFLKYGARSGVRHLRFHWSDHPVYGAGAHVADGKVTSPWYESECATMTVEDIARELDISDAASVRGRAFPEFSVDTHVQIGASYQGGRLFSGWDFGIRASVFSIQEQRSSPAGGLEVVTLAACEFANATADMLAVAFQGELLRVTGDSKTPCHNYGDPAGNARTQTTGTSIIDELGKLGVYIDAPQRLRDVTRRVRTTRLMLAGKVVPNGQTVVYRCGGADAGLKWLQECIEQAKWPTDIDGVVRGEPTDLEDDTYTHHADAFSSAVEGMYGTSSSTLPSVPRGGAHHRPVTAGIRDRRY